MEILFYERLGLVDGSFLKDAQIQVVGKVDIWLPLGDMKGNNYTTLGGMAGNGASFSNKKEAAIEFAKYRTSEEAQKLGLWKWVIYLLLKAIQWFRNKWKYYFRNICTHLLKSIFKNLCHLIMLKYQKPFKIQCIELY